MTIRPQSVHQWAQCDRASVAYIFGSESLNIMEPQTHNIENGSGITGMEFPLLNYCAGLLYRIFGFHEIIYRLLVFTIALFGLLAAFEIAMYYTGSPISSSLTVLSFSFSPVLLYYMPNFLPDTASVGFIILAWLFFLKLQKTFKSKYLFLMGLFTLLACLIKISSFISVIAMVVIVILDYFHFFSSKNSITIFNKKRSSILITLGTVSLTVFSWYYYASWLSEVNNSNVFLLKAKITFSPDEIIDNIIFIKNLWWQQYYSVYFYYAILASSIFIIAFRKHAPKMLSAITTLLWLGNLSFSFLMLSQFRDHDYYIITLLPVIFFHLLLFSKVFLSVFESKKIVGLVVLNVLLIAITTNGFLFCRDNLNLRHNKDGWMSSPDAYEKYFDLHTQLKKLGVSDDALVLSIVDDSPNISLYLMNHRGFTVSAYEDNKSIEEKINSLKSKNSYIIMNDSSYLEKNISGISNRKIMGTINGLIIIDNN